MKSLNFAKVSPFSSSNNADALYDLRFLQIHFYGKVICKHNAYKVINRKAS